MKKIIAILSMILAFSMLCGCLDSSDFRDVNKITTIEFSYKDEESGNEHYLFDLERGVFSARLDDESLEDSAVYELEQKETEVIRNAFVPSRKWKSNFIYEPGINMGLTAPDPAYRIVIEYSDGTSSVLNGSSRNGEKWPEGFEDLKSTLDDIAMKRLYEDIDPAAKETELISLLSEYDPRVYRNTDPGNEYLDDDGYSIAVNDGDGERMYVEYYSGKFTLDYRNWHEDYGLIRMDYEDLLRDINIITGSRIGFVVVRSNGDVLSIWTTPDSECSREEMISKVHDLQNRYDFVMEQTKEYGYQIEGKFFDTTRNFVYEIDPEG